MYDHLHPAGRKNIAYDIFNIVNCFHFFAFTSQLLNQFSVVLPFPQKKNIQNFFYVEDNSSVYINVCFIEKCGEIYFSTKSFRFENSDYVVPWIPAKKSEGWILQ